MAVGSIVARILTQYSDKGSKAASKDIMKLGKSFDKFSKKAGKAFLLVGAASAAFAIKIGKDAVQAAIADQKSQVLLANSLRNTTGATDSTIAATEMYITKLQKQFSVVDDDLRPAFGRLAALTGSTTAAQSLLGTALDVSAQSGVDLSTATDAIIKSSTGQFRSLKKLVPSLSAATMKSKNFGAALDEVAKATQGAAGKRAETLEFRLQGLRIAFGEVLETLGYALLPVLEKFATTLSTKLIPQFEVFIAQNKDKLAQAFATAAEFALQFLTVAMAFSTWVSNNTTTVKTLAGFIAGMFIVSGVANFLTTLAAITAAYRVLAATATGAAIASAFATGGISAYAGLAGVAVVTAALTANAVKGGGGSTPSTSTSKPTFNGYLGSMPVGSAIAQTPSIGATKTTDTLAAFLAALNKNTTATVKNTKSVMDQATESAMKQLAARQAALSGSASIAIGGSGAKAFSTRNSNGGMNVVVNGVIGSPDEVVRVVEDGIANSSRRNGRSGGGGRMMPLVL